MKIGQKIGERSVEIIKSTEFTEYLAEKVHQTNDPDETFAQKLSSALITMGIVKPDEQPLSYEECLTLLEAELKFMSLPLK